MRKGLWICFTAAALLAGFALWGLRTEGGDGAFGTAEVIPVAAGVASALLTICGVIAWGMSRRR